MGNEIYTSQSEDGTIEIVQSAEGGNTGLRRYRARLFTQKPNTRDDIVVADGMSTATFEANPVVLYNHDRYSLPIGRAVEVIRNKRSLDAVIEFDPEDPRAQDAEGKIQRGFLRTLSVGFKVHEAEPVDPKSRDWLTPMRFQKTELIEISVVSVPADVTAIIKQAYGDYRAANPESQAEYLTRVMDALDGA